MELWTVKVESMKKAVFTVCNSKNFPVVLELQVVIFESTKKAHFSKEINSFKFDGSYLQNYLS